MTNTRTYEALSVLFFLLSLLLAGISFLLTMVLRGDIEMDAPVSAGVFLPPCLGAGLLGMMAAGLPSLFLYQKHRQRRELVTLGICAVSLLIMFVDMLVWGNYAFHNTLPVP